MSAGSVSSFMGVSMTPEMTATDIEQVGGALMVSGSLTAQYPGGGDVDFVHSLGKDVAVQAFNSVSETPVILNFTRHPDRITFHFPSDLYESTFKVIIVG
jgi:hypothetical protein